MLLLRPLTGVLAHHASSYKAYSFRGEPPYQVEVDSSDGVSEVELNNIPVSFASSLPMGVAEIRIRSGNNLVAKIDPIRSILKTAIESVPERGFSSPSLENKNELLEMVNTVDSLVQRKQYASLKDFLLGTLRPKVVDSVIDEFEKINPAEYDQSDVLSVVDILIQRANQIALSAGANENSLFELILDKQNYMTDERAQFQVLAKKLPTNSELEYEIEIEIDDLKNKVDKISDRKWVGESSRLTLGGHKIQLIAKVIDKESNRKIRKAEIAFRKEIHRIDFELRNETDIEKRHQLEAKKNEFLQKIDKLHQEKNRRMVPVSESLEVYIYVNS